MHEEYMKDALSMAQEALEEGEVPIGCIIVNLDGKVVAKGRNRTNESKNATRHAEFEALDVILAKAKEEESQGTFQDPSFIRRIMSQYTLYVTVEPCIMCAAALRKKILGLTKVYFGCYNERFGGCGSIIPAHIGYVSPLVDPPLTTQMLSKFRKPCVELLRVFYLKENERAPMPRKKAKRSFKPIEIEEEDSQVS